jgi:hypothetical protein
LSSTAAAAAKAHRQGSVAIWITRLGVFTVIEAEDPRTIGATIIDVAENRFLAHSSRFSPVAMGQLQQFVIGS